MDGSHLLTYIAAYTSHDGSYSLTFKDTNIRQECANKPRPIDAEMTGLRVPTRHTSNNETKKAEAIKLLTYAQKRVNALAEHAELLIAKKLSDQKAVAILNELAPLTLDGQPKVGKALTMAQNTHDKVMGVYRGAPTQ